MSRIAGIVKPRESGAHQVNKALLAIAGQNPQTANWAIKLDYIDDLYFGWAGWRGEPFVRQNNIVLILDGNIYNENDLKISHSAEQKHSYLIDLYYRYGFAGMLMRLNGDFVIVLYDKKEKILFIGRDRFGIKPLYYTKNNDTFCFASRCASLFALGVAANPDPNFVGRFAGTHYRYIDNIPEQSPYAGIKQLPAAHYLQIKLDKPFNASSFNVQSWWTLNEKLSFEVINEEKLAEQYQALLFDAVKIRLAKAERPIFTLSGGMDSSSVLASAVHTAKKKFHAVSTVYEDKTYDESNEIHSMLEATVEKWHTVNIGNPNVFELVNLMIKQHDEPIATATWLSHFLLCEAIANKNFGSVFGGLGGDELNAGEYEHFFFHFADLKHTGQNKQYEHEVKKWCEYHDHPVFKKTPEIAAQSLQHMIDFSESGRCLPEQTRMFRYVNVLNPDLFNNKFQPRMEKPFSSYLKNRTYQDIFFETAPCCLRAEDRQATAFNLEKFLPFFDHRLVEFMFSVPGTLKIQDGVTKSLLRKAMHGILPDETRTRIKKTGWNAPAHQWFSNKGLLELKELIYSPTFRQRGIYNLSQLDIILSEHEAIVSKGEARDNHMMFLWQLVNLELWLRSIPA